MQNRSLDRLLLVGITLAGIQCGPLERSNPADPAADSAPGEPAALTLSVPLPKPLAPVVHRVVARLEGTGVGPIEKELVLSPLGPASGTIGALAPGSGLTLTIRGYDLEDALLFEGVQSGITITAGDTTTVDIDLVLTQPLAPDGEGDGEGDGDA